MLIKYFQYKQWADQRTIAAIRQLTENAVDTLAFVNQQLNHMTIVEELFKARLSGLKEPHKNTNTELLPTMDELEQRNSKQNHWYQDFVDTLEPESHYQQIDFVFADGKRGSMLVAEILFHIINHGSYHRGNIAHALDLAGVPHPIDGYGIYIHEKEPQRRQP